ncbi:DMT family transporter [Nonomuraea sp. NPDC005650]|uniref:DMT family transporter n=1 Tax=Nonomuraea sp. NPDC005650 TaxID=3157045 RepID=UPI0033AC89B3
MADSTARAGSVGAQFVALAIVWGASFLFIKVSLEGLSPAQVMVGRLALGGIFLAAVMLATRRRWPRDVRTWGSLAVISVFLCVAPFLLYAWAGQYIPSGLSSIYNATTPIAALLVSLIVLPDERLTRARTAGLLIAAVGVVVVAAPWSTVGEAHGGPLFLAQLACLGANLCYGIGFVLSRRLLRTNRYDPTTIAAGQIVLAAAIGLVLAPFIGGFEPVLASPSVVTGLLALGVIGTGLAYIWNTRVIAAWGATAASTVTYVTPVVGVILGILVLGETIHWNEPAGGLLVILGILISQGRLTPRRPGRSASHDADRRPERTSP